MPSKPLKAIKPMFLRNVWRIVRGDMVQIRAGKDKGTTGRVLRVIRDKRFPRVLVEEKNMVTRHIRKDVKTGRPGFAVRMEAPIHYSNIMLVTPGRPEEGGGKPVRSIYQYLQISDKEVHKVRIPRGRNAIAARHIARPERTPGVRKSQEGLKDTNKDEAKKKTYDPKTDFLPSYLPRALREHVPYVPQGLRSYYTVARPSGSIFSSSSSSVYSSQQQQQQRRALALPGSAASSSSSMWRHPWQRHLGFAACPV